MSSSKSTRLSNLKSSPSSETHRAAFGFLALGLLICGYAVLGPLVLGEIRFATSASGLNQIQGGDLAALCIVAPSCFAVAWLAWRNHPAATTLGLAPAMFAMYTYSQLILGNEYTYRPGNVERYFPLLLAIFILAAALAILCWTSPQCQELPPLSRRLERGSGILLITIAVLVVFGIHLAGFIDAVSDHPDATAYLETPNTFWVVKFYDMGIVVPAALAVGWGLLRRRAWAQKPAYAILGGYVLLGWSVAGMACTMLLHDDPEASLSLALALIGVAGAGSVFAWRLYRPLFQVSAPPRSIPSP